MKRRALLAGISTTVMFGMSGYLSENPSDPGNNAQNPDEITFETQHDTARILKEGGIDVGGEVPRSEQLIITTETEADERIESSDEIEAFVREKNFEESYIVAVEAGTWQCQLSLEVERIERTNGGLQLSLIRDGPDEPPDDACIHSLAVRITDHERGVPEYVEVRIDGEETGTAKSSWSLSDYLTNRSSKVL